MPTSPLRISYSDPVEAARGYLARQGAHVPEHLLRGLVDRVLAAADTVVTAHHTANRVVWERDDYRSYIRSDLRRKLLSMCADQGLVPTQLPVEELTHHDTRMGGMLPTGRNQIPADAIERGAEWDYVDIRLSVPARRPPIDRAAAVRAGVV